MSSRFWLYLFLLFHLLTVLTSCEPTVKKANLKNEVDPTERIKNQIVKVNQLELQKESDEMDAYERSHQLNFVKTNSGIRYLVYKPSMSGDSLRDNMEVEMDYEVKLLDGTLCYSSKIDGKKKLIIGAEEAESGLHKGLLYLKRGDKALILIPSVLAHGLLGDFKKIPPQMPIIFDIAVH